MSDSKSDENPQLKSLGDFIRTQRRITHLSLRQLANMAQISNPYLSQVERGLYRPSAEVLKGIAQALGMSPEKLFTEAGLLDDDDPNAEAPEVEQAIRLDTSLAQDQKEALISIYRGLKAKQPLEK
jgi:transcriptional regulator with XRE-family HTH domain